MRWLLWCFCLLAESYETINHWPLTNKPLTILPPRKYQLVAALVTKDFAQISPNVHGKTYKKWPQKTFSCEFAPFFSNQSTSSAISARIFRNFAKVFTHFAQNSTDFSRILREFARIFTTSKLSWWTFTPASYTTVLRGYMLFFYQSSMRIIYCVW